MHRLEHCEHTAKSWSKVLVSICAPLLGNPESYERMGEHDIFSKPFKGAELRSTVDRLAA